MCIHPCDVSIFPVTPAPWAPGSLHAWWPCTGTREIRRSPDSWLHSKCNCGLFHTDLHGWCFMTGVPDKGYRGWYNHPAPTAGNSWIWGLLEVWEDATQHFWQTHTDRDRVQSEAKLTILPLVTLPITFHAHVPWGTQPEVQRWSSPTKARVLPAAVLGVHLRTGPASP